MIGIIQGKTTVAEASRPFDLSPSEIEGWVEDATRGMDFERDRGCSAAAQAPKMSLRANPLDIREQDETPLKDLQEACGEAMPELHAPKEPGPAGCMSH